MTVRFDPRNDSFTPVSAISRGRAALTLTGLVVVGVLIDQALRVDHASLAVPIACAATLATFLVAAASRRGGAIGLGSIAVLLASAAVMRTDPWVVAPDLCGAFVALILAATYAGGGRATNLPLRGVGRRIGHGLGAVGRTPVHTVHWLGAVRGPHRRPFDRGATIRIALIAVPLLGVLALLLVSADPILASWLDLANADAGAGHVVLASLGALAGGSLVVTALTPQVSDPPGRPPWFGRAEALFTLAGLVAVYGLFAAAQSSALLGGDGYVQTTTGLTYAEYARHGFAQLIGAASITVAALLALRASAASASGAARVWMVGLGGLTSTLTLASLVVAVKRLDLYADAFGLTESRFLALAFTVWIGLVLVAATVGFAVRSRRAWVVPSVGLITATWLLGLTALNPAARVMEHNLERAGQGHALDLGYVRHLPDEALPALADGLDRLSPSQAKAARELLCRRRVSSASGLGWNLTLRRAAAAQRQAC